MALWNSVSDVFTSLTTHIRRFAYDDSTPTDFNRRFGNVTVVSIYLVTWNVNGKPPPSDFTDLLQLNRNPLPEIYCIGLQEMGVQSWESALMAALKPFDYVKIKSRQLVGILTIMFVHRNCLQHVTSVESELTRSGLAGFYGNKGAASIRMDFMGMNLIVVNCHLAAHMENVAERLNNIDQILSTQQFRDPDTDNILDHDYIFWMGDMNFRIEETTYEKTLELIDLRNFKKLYRNDQLYIAIQEGLIFDMFQEGTITFPPTYKFDPGTDKYDSSAKRRIPAYCDRILYHFHDTAYGNLKLQAKLIEYICHPEYKMSDHKPVSAIISFKAISKGTINLITFRLPNKVWNKKKEETVSYLVRKDFRMNSGDWIGLFKEDFQDFDSFVTYVWANTKTPLSPSHPVSVHFSSYQQMSLSAGKYVLCYLTKKASLCGVSPLIEIV
ncbi:inositol polyphosphate 5-phosphatase K-like isoform X1 [Biomphalaria glabrata]|uniref:Inositol polyphosphate 5-phosphatase K-like isoform X1 n=1 Tax=Biomphalaria glabrata TaxID=6526 RepID=A0A9W2YGF9_BIOGL|nr:inositol polyphosphate 5-phosphatase K-like isoform X1 [Biomphalaria glabrata]KAI8753315.1 inositol polyphosphate 5-phosphatase K-like isoform X1 [Biomphalaria glabrata]